MALISKQFFLRRSNMLKFLDELEETNDPTALSVYMLPGLSVPGIEDLLGKAGAQSLPVELIQAAANSKNGAVIFWGSVLRISPVNGS